MELQHIRVMQNTKSTKGVLLHVNGDNIRVVCEILEDGYSEIKYWGECRIDKKKYFVVPIRYGKFYDPYRKKHGHKFVPALMDEIGVDKAGRHDQIRVHKLNQVSQTLGCPGVGNIVEFNEKTKLFEIPNGQSEPAYLRFYDLLTTVYDEAANKFTEPVFWDIKEQL